MQARRSSDLWILSVLTLVLERRHAGGCPGPKECHFRSAGLGRRGWVSRPGPMTATCSTHRPRHPRAGRPGGYSTSQQDVPDLCCCDELSTEMSVALAATATAAASS